MSAWPETGDAAFFTLKFLKNHNHAAYQLPHKENRMKKLLRVSLLIALVALMAVLALPYFASATILYTNGPISGVLQAWSIIPHFGPFVITDSFSLSGPSTITGADFGSWVNKGDTPLSVDWAITTGPFTGTTVASGTGSLGYTYLFTNALGYDIGQDSFSIPLTTLPGGTYWFQLRSGVTAMNGYMAWDINNGPSVAFQNVIGNVANYLFPGSNSDSFQIVGTPLPPSVLLLGSGLLCLLGLRRFRKG